MNRLEISSFKERVDLVKVVGHFLTLEKKGAAYLGLCPFHDDHHPSLRVDPVKGYTTVLVAGQEGMFFVLYRKRKDAVLVRRSVSVRISVVCPFPYLMREYGSW